MKFLIQIVLTAVVGYALQMFLPWWSVIAGSILVGALGMNTVPYSFLAGFFGIALLWGVVAFMTDQSNASVLSEKVAGVFSLSSGSLMMLVTAVVGGVCGGLGGLTGSLFREVF